nr:hypothetical protein [Pseudactinotalea terrae]
MVTLGTKGVDAVRRRVSSRAPGTEAATATRSSGSRPSCAPARRTPLNGRSNGSSRTSAPTTAAKRYWARRCAQDLPDSRDPRLGKSLRRWRRSWHTSAPADHLTAAPKP